MASPIVYSSVIKDGTTGFIYHNGREFISKLNTLIKNKNLRRKVAEEAYSYVRHERLMSQHYEERLDWYRELLAKLPELTAEAEARIAKFIPQFNDEITKFRARFSRNPKERSTQIERNLTQGAEIIIPE